MQLLALGTGGRSSLDGRLTPCFYLPQHGIFLDLGQGLTRFRRCLKAYRLELKEELIALVSHLHADHIDGLRDLKFELNGIKSLTIYGPNRLEERVRAYFDSPTKDSPYALSSHPFSISFKELASESEFEINGTKVKAMPLRHTNSNETVLAYRFESEKVLSYLVDVKPTKESIEFIKHSDILVHSCTTSCQIKSEEFENTKELAELVNKAHIDILVIFHLAKEFYERDKTHLIFYELERFCKPVKLIMPQDGELLKL